MTEPIVRAADQANRGAQRSKWTRVSGRKVRTGCITWIRHLKCDEGKPTCQRCGRDDRQCDGYEAANQPRPIAKREAPPCSAVGQRRQHLTRGQFVPLLPLITTDISKLKIEKLLFHHVQECTVKDFTTPLGSGSFWYSYALPLGYSIDPIKHALCALGAAHRASMSRGLHHSYSSLPHEDSGKLAIRHYNEAIFHIQALMSTPSATNIQTILVCCIIFICVESVQGRYPELLQHLRAGWRLLECFPPVQNTPTISRPGEHRLDTHFFRDVSGMLSRLNLDSNIYTGDDLVPNPGCFLLSAVHIGDPHMPFSSSVEAEKLLHDIDLLSESAMDPPYQGCGLPDDDFYDEEDHDSRIMESSHVFGENKITCEDISNLFWAWSARFDLFFDQIQIIGSTETELHRARVLSLHQAVWKAMLKLDDEEDRPERQDCENILSLAELLVRSGGSEAHPIFTLHADLIPPLCFVGLYSGDADIQQRATTLLRSMRRREGIWDSHEVAEILEIMHLAARQDLLASNMIPCGLTQLAKMLSDLQLPSLHTANGALLLPLPGVDK